VFRFKVVGLGFRFWVLCHM